MSTMTRWREWLKGRAMGPERVPRVVPDDACPLGEETLMPNDGSIERLADDVAALCVSRDKHGERIGDLKEKIAILEDRLKQRQEHWHRTDSVVTGLQLADSFRDGRLVGIDSLLARLDLDVRRVESDGKAVDIRSATEHAELHERINRLRGEVTDNLAAWTKEHSTGGRARVALVFQAAMMIASLITLIVTLIKLQGAQ